MAVLGDLLLKKRLEYHWTTESVDLTIPIHWQPAVCDAIHWSVFIATHQDRPRPLFPASQVTKGSN